MGGKKWYTGAIYIKVEGRWCYLSRDIDKQGNLVDVYLSNVRDQAVADFFCALIFYIVFEEVRQFFTNEKQNPSLSSQGNSLNNPVIQ